MKNIFSGNRRTVEIILTLLLVFIAGGYYYLIYIPARENEIIQRRFRTLRRVEVNMQQKFGGYVSTLKSFIGRFNDAHINQTGIDTLLKQYDKANWGKFDITGQRVDSFSTVNSKDSVVIPNPNDTSKIRDINCHGITVVSTSNGKNLKIIYDTVFDHLDENRIIDYKKHVRVEASINYPQFLIPLLHKGIFDHYVVFNDRGETSNIIYEDFPSGISFNSVDSLFNTTKQIYTSKIINIESGGEKYLVFLHPCGYNQKNDRIIAGFQKQETFDKQKRQLPESLVTTILFIALFCFLLLPVIRLGLMGKNERIRFFDLFTAYFSFLLLVPVIILVFFWNYRNFIPKSNDDRDSKKVLADQISRSFKNELDSIYTLMDKIDSLRDTTQHFNPDLSVLVKDTINVRRLARDGSPHYFDKKNKSDSVGIDYAVHYLDSLLKKDSIKDVHPEYVFWLDSATGTEVANWSFGEDPPRGNYQDRDYFTNARDNNVVSLYNNQSKTFAFEPVISRNDGQFKFVISKKSRRRGLIVACPSRLHSVINPFLPVGFNFSITDDEGNTIFDSDTTDNLNENLAEEMNDSSAFKAALNTRTSQEFTTRFEDEGVDVLVQPIGGLPYFIVICEKTSFASALNTQVFSFTIVTMFSFFLFLCVELIIVFICRHRQTKLLKNSFDLSWIHPRQSLSHKYFFVFLFNISLLIALALFCFTNFSMQKLTGYIFLFVMASLLSSIGACLYKARYSGGQLGGMRKKRRRTATIVLGILAIFVLANSWYYSSETGGITTWFTVSAIALFLIIIGITKGIDEVNVSSYATNFHRMIFSKLLLTSGIPVIVFFFCSNNFEQKLQERFKLLAYAENIEQRVKDGEKLESIIGKIKNDTTAVKTFYTDSVWINHAAEDSIPSGASGYCQLDSISLSLLKTSRVHYNDVSAATENFELMTPYISDSDHFLFSNIFNGSNSILQYRITETENERPGSTYIRLSSSGTQMSKVPSLFAFPEGVIFWGFLVVALAICYQLLKYTVNKIFGIRIPGNEDFKGLNEILLKDNSIRYLFVQGIPGSGKTNFIKNNLQADDKYIFYNKRNPSNNYNAIIFNLEEISATEEIENKNISLDRQSGSVKVQNSDWENKIAILDCDKIKCIVFTHFEYNILDDDTNKIKLGLVEKLLSEGNKKIIITSDIDPVEYFNSLKKFAYDSSEKKNKKAENKNGYKESTYDKEVDNSSFPGYIYRWNNLLGRFTNIYTDNNASRQPRSTNNSFSKHFIANEFGYPLFLKKYQCQFEKYPCCEETSEDNILKIQSLSDQSYREIWHSLTKEEQITLYDLAEDGLVNTTNDRTLTILINKGLIVNKDGVLMPVNHSFRNFILMIVHPATLKNIEKKVSDGQTWNDYKYPVLIILATLVYFVFYSSPEKFGNVLPLVSGIMAGVPTILKLLSYMKPAEK